MKLTDDPDAAFFRIEMRGGKEYHVDVTTLAEAQGVRFTCPLCGAHDIGALFRDRGVPDAATPGPGRWTPSGTSLDDLTLSPSIDLSRGPGCNWHGFVTNGEAR